MKSAGTPVGTSVQSSLSAKKSMKRSRILYARNPETTFIPTTDPIILQNSIDRRKRRVARHQTDNRQNFGSSGPLAIVAGTADTKNDENTLEMKPVSSSALIVQNNNIGKEGAKKKILNTNRESGTIIVVCFYTFLYLYGDSTYSVVLLCFVFPNLL